jgi:hypothetical protein
LTAGAGDTVSASDPVLTEGAMAEEMDDDLAAIAEHEAATATEPVQTILDPALNLANRPIPDPAKEAVYDKLALRSQVLKEQTEKLKAIEAGTYLPDPVTPPVTAPVSAPAAPVEAKAEAKPAPKRAAKPKSAAPKSSASKSSAADKTAADKTAADKTAADKTAADKTEAAAADGAPKKSPRKKKADNV